MAKEVWMHLTNWAGQEIWFSQLEDTTIEDGSRVVSVRPCRATM